jgi:hypothetical protein
MRAFASIAAWSWLPDLSSQPSLVSTLSISTALRALHSEVTALKEGCHPERSVLCEVKSLP